MVFIIQKLLNDYSVVNYKTFMKILVYDSIIIPYKWVIAENLLMNLGCFFFDKDLATRRFLKPFYFL